MCFVLDLVHTSDESVSCSFNDSSISRDMTLGENRETRKDLVFILLNIMANEAFLP